MRCWRSSTCTCARSDCQRLEFGELHFGGGTPTFLTPERARSRCCPACPARSRLRADAVASIEVDPRVTSAEQLEVLARYGFRRISLGVQDFDPRVQAIVNRVQSEQQVRDVTQAARALGFDSVNFDLIYGLPLQTRASIEATMDAVCRLRPDRIALYGYAHVPWIKPGQRRFTEIDLPEGEQKRAAVRAGPRAPGARGLSRDRARPLRAREPTACGRRSAAARCIAISWATPTAFTRPMIGLGVSSIGDAGDAFAQNEKDLQRYQERVALGELPIQRGHLLNAEDQVLRRHILRLMTRLQTRLGAAGRLHRLPEHGDRSGWRNRLPTDWWSSVPRSCRVTEKGRALSAQHLHGVRRPAGAPHAGQGAVQPHGVMRPDVVASADVLRRGWLDTA